MNDIINTYLPIIITIVLTYLFTRRQETANKVRENRINLLKEYLKAFQALRLATQSYYYQFEFGVHTQEKFNEKAAEVRQARIEYDLQVLMLNMFLKKGDQHLINIITDRLEQARVSVTRIIHMGEADTSLWTNDKIEKIDKDFAAVPYILNEELPVKIKTLGKNFRIDFGIELSSNWIAFFWWLLLLFFVFLFQLWWMINF